MTPLQSVRRVFACAGLLVAAAQVYQLPVHMHDDNADAGVYARAARHCASGAPVYGDWSRSRLDVPTNSFIYPPTALAVLCPVGGANEMTIKTVSLVLMLLAFWLLAAALGLLATGVLSWETALATGAVIQLTGVGMVTSFGNADLAVLAMIAWAFAVPRAAAPLLVVATALKVYPVFVLVSWWPAMTRRQMRSGAITAAVVVGLYVLTGASRYYHEWTAIGMPTLSELVLPGGNWSLSTLLLRPFVSGELATTPAWAHTFLTVVPLVAVFGALIWSRKLPRDVRGCIVLMVGIAFAPICWWWRLTTALTIPGAVWIRERKELLCESP